jgi:hypothetical protein
MANTFLTIKMITQEALMILENNLVFGKQVNREYNDQFAKSGAKIGYSVNVRLPVKYNGTVGKNLNVEDATETFVPVTLTTQYHVDISASTADFALSIDDFSKRFLQPAVAKIANKIDTDGLALADAVYNTVGSIGAANTLKTYLEAAAKLDYEATPRDQDRAVVIGPYAQALLVDQLKGLFNDTTEVASQYKNGTMGRTAGYKFSMDQNVRLHTFGSGVGNAVIVNGASQVGATLTVSGLTGNLKAGDTFTIANVYGVNPVSLQSTGKLRQFVVLADVANAGTSLTISPAIVGPGSPYQTVTALPANSAALTFIGAAAPGTTVELGLAFHKNAFTLVTADLPLPGGVDMAARASDDQLGISVRIIRDYLPATDELVTRLDVLYGWAVLRPEFAVKIINDNAVF